MYVISGGSRHDLSAGFPAPEMSWCQFLEITEMGILGKMTGEVSLANRGVGVEKPQIDPRPTSRS
jgi:hypothetical protein